MGVALKLVEVLCFFLKSKPFFSLFRWLPPGSYRVCLGMDPFLWKRTDLAWAATVLVHFNGGGGGGWGLKFFPSLQTSYGGLFFRSNFTGLPSGWRRGNSDDFSAGEF